MKIKSAITAVILLLLAASTAKPADDRDQPAKSLQELKDQACMQFLKANGPLPSTGKLPIASIIELGEGNGFLAASTEVTAGKMRTQCMRFQATDANGEGTIMVLPQGKIQNRELKMIIFDYTDFTPADVIATHIQVISQAWQLQLTRDVMEPGKTVTMQLIQTLNPPHVTLRIQDVAEGGGVAGRPSVYEADSFAVLRRKHCAAVERDVRPLFLDLHQDAAVFAVEPQIAWQVLYDAWQAPPDIAATVNPLVDQLNDDAFAKCDDADKKLRNGRSRRVVFAGNGWFAMECRAEGSHRCHYCSLSPVDGQGCQGDGQGRGFSSGLHEFLRGRIAAGRIGSAANGVGPKGEI